jgi:hypothetical protein
MNNLSRNVSRKARSAMNTSSDWRNLLDPYERLAYTIVNRATTDYTRVTDRICKGDVNEHELKILNARRQSLRDEFTDPLWPVSRLVELLPAFDHMDGEDVLDRLDAARREKSAK